MERGPSLFGGGRSLKHQSRIQRGGSGSREISLDSSPKSSESSSSSSSYAIDHSLVAILNNPHVGKLGVFGGEAPWSSWFSSSSGSFAEFPPLPANKTVTEITRSDFRQYLSSISECYGRFEDIRHHASKELIEIEESSGEIKERGQGDSLVACLREVPSLYFKEDFALEDGGTFQAACPFSSIAETAALQENLSHYLDVVEVHLVKEISLRSDSFFEAQGKLQDLNGQILEACGRLRELKETIRLLESDLVDSARNVQELNRKRRNFLELQQKLRLIQYVSQALAAMKLLIAAADCAGALDVTDDLQHLLDSGELSGLHCFRHLQDQLAMAVESINSVLAAEFMRSVIRDVKGLDLALLSKLREKGADLIGHTKEVALDEEESSSLRDRLLPVIIGLLRTATLPAVLRVYRETIISEVKKAIKNTVANLLPELVARPTGTNSQPGDRSPENDGGGVSLADKLRSLSSYNFVLLLAAIFTVVQAHLLLAAEVKKVIEWVMGGLDGSYAADSVAAALALGAAAAAAAEAAQEKDHRYVSSSPNSIQWKTNKVNSLQAKVNEASTPSNQSKNFRADVLRENTEAIFAACDTAQFRWAKLLGVRAQLHPKLRIQDFLNIYTITQEFISATEKIGGRLGYQLRGTVQSQSKAFVDFQHLSRMEKITAVLDQETWVTIDVPGEFQVIVDLFVSAVASANGDLTSDTAVESNSRDMLAWDENTHSEISQHENENHSDDTAQNRTPNASASRPSDNQDTVPENSIPTHPNDHSIRESGRSTTMLIYRGVGYHMVNCGLILLKMLSEYIDISKCFPSLSSEVVHRVVEILKHFNTRTCQLVLGARAMQVSGLKSITAKHLALASQVVSFFYAIIPEIRQTLMLQIPENRRTLLLSEIDRVAQDYKVHRNEIHAKLVQIMKERLLYHLRALPQTAESWNNPEDPDSQRNQFARPLTKEVGILQRVLSRTLLATDVQAIFREVLQIFHSHLTEAFSNLEVNTPQASERLCQEIQNILVCLHSLPSDTSNTGNLSNSGLLDEFLMERFGIQHNNGG